MKCILLLICLLSSCTNLIAQDGCGKEFLRYKEVYNYILNDSINRNKKINVSDTIVNLNFALFWRELKNADESESDFFTRLYSLPQTENYYYKCLSLLENNGKGAKSIVFFSPIVNDTFVCAELFDDKIFMDQFDYNLIGMQNTSHVYLFIFDKEGGVKSIFNKEMHYSF